MHDRAAPAAMLQLARERPGVVAGRAAFQAVEKNDQGGARGAGQAVDVDEVRVRSVPALPLPRDLRMGEQDPVQGLQVRAR